MSVLPYLPLLFEVKLVPNEDHSHSLQASSAVLLHFLDPTHQVFKCLLSGDVIYQHNALGKRGGREEEQTREVFHTCVITLSTLPSAFL